MKTQNPNVALWRANHHKALESLATETGGQCLPGSGKRLWQALRAIERQLEPWILNYTNGDGGTTMEDVDRECARARREVSNLFGGVPRGFFINRDPRGYALKLDNEKVTIPSGLHTDMGGYGILAAEIND